MSVDLWTEASADHESLARQAALARAEAEFNGVFPFLAAARSQGEYAQRRALAEENLALIARRHGIDPDEIFALADRRFALLLEALQEGQDPLEWVPDGGGYGSGPEEPLEHDEAVDYSHGYSEVPQGAPGGPDPRVVATGARHRLQTEGKHRKAADATDMVSDSTDTGLGAGSVDTGVGATDPTLPAGMQNSAQPQPSPIGQVTSAADPVRRQVMAVTASIRATNPALPEDEASRLARKVVGRYLHADLDSSVVSNDPGGEDGQDGGQGGGGMSGMEKAMVGRSVIKAAPELLDAVL
jgi:hypothetical protein